MPVNFHTIEIAMPRFGKNLIKNLLVELIQTHKKTLGDVDVIFCSDQELLKMNRKYLEHDFYTDVITFDYSDEYLISGDIFISIDRVRSNAKKMEVNVENEIRRIIGHGVLHLIGLKDKSIVEKAKMTEEEEKFLKLFD